MPHQSMMIAKTKIKAKIRTYGDKAYTNFRGLNVPKSIESRSFAVISIDSLLLCNNKYYQKAYLDSCACKIAKKQTIDYLGDNLSKTGEYYFLINGFVNAAEL